MSFHVLLTKLVDTNDLLCLQLIFRTIKVVTVLNQFILQTISLISDSVPSINHFLDISLANTFVTQRSTFVFCQHAQISSTKSFDRRLLRNKYGNLFMSF